MGSGKAYGGKYNSGGAAEVESPGHVPAADTTTAQNGPAKAQPLGPPPLALAQAVLNVRAGPSWRVQRIYLLPTQSRVRE
jgi:hypothetical protein